MFAVRRIFPLILVIAGLSLLAGCGQDSSSGSGAADFVWQPVFGDGINDTSEVIATVGDLEISYRDLQMFLEELPPAIRARYQGPEGERLAVQKMIETAVMVKGSVEMELYNDADVARTIISQRRHALDSAMRNYGLLRGRKPDEDSVREYFVNNRPNYRQLAMMEARHIEVATKETAVEVWNRLQKDGNENSFIMLVPEYSLNEVTKFESGKCGWFNQGGQLPIIRGGEVFTKKCFTLPKGLNPPFEVAGRWHVVEVMQTNPERPMSFKEARGKVEMDMLPAFQNALIKDYILEARKRYGVTLTGRFAPGQGLTPEQIFVQGMNAGDPDRRVDLFNMIYTDFPASKEADDALFMAANVALESYKDVKVAERYLRILLAEYPDSELVSDAQFLLDNLYNPEVLNPTSFEDLQKSQ